MLIVLGGEKDALKTALLRIDASLKLENLSTQEINLLAGGITFGMHFRRILPECDTLEKLGNHIGPPAQPSR